LSEEEEEEQG
jgi:actin-related protein 5